MQLYRNLLKDQLYKENYIVVDHIVLGRKPLT